jgi:WD40 repeat protein
MPDLFISYSRTDRAAANAINDALKARQVTAWIDLKDIPPSLPWQEEAGQAIEAADALLLLISPAFLQSSNCHWEVEYAIQNNKRFIPVILDDVDVQAVPAPARSLNWVFLRPADDFPAGIERIIEALRTDPAWLHTHTRLLQRALEWERRKGESSLLLHGHDLEEAEKWLASAAPTKNPQPNLLHTRYIIESRRDSTRRARRTTLIITAGLLLTIFLAIFAWTQRNASQIAANQRSTAQVDAENGQKEALRQQATAQAASTLAVAQRSTAQSASTLAVAQKNEAVRQAQLTHSGLLVAQAITQLFEKPDLSLLLAIESSRMADNFSSRSALYTVLDYVSNLSFYLRGHSGAVVSLAFSPDGSRLVSGAADGDLRLWDTSTGRLAMGPIHIGQGSVSQVAFSPDGRFLVTLGHASPLCLWDAATGHLLLSLPGAADAELNSFAFSPDGKLLITSNNLGSLSVYNTATNQLIYQAPKAASERLGSLTFEPNGRFVTMYDSSGSVREWDILNRAMYGLPFQRRTSPASNLALSPDGKYLAAGDLSGIQLWDVNTHQPVDRPFTGHTDLVTQVVFSPDSRYLISGSADKTVRVWDVETGQVLQTLKQDSAVTSLAISADGVHLASGAESGIVNQWNPSYTPAFETWTIQTGHTLAALAFSQQGKALAAVGDNGFVNLWDVASHQPLPPASGGAPQDYYKRLAISPDGQVMAVSIWNRDILLLDPAGKPFGHLSQQGPTGYINDLAFSPDGRILAAASSDSNIYLWDMQSVPQSSAPIQAFTGQALSMALAFSPDGRLLAVGSTEGTLRLWDTATRQPVGQTFPSVSAGSIVSLAFSPDGKSLAAASQDGVILVLDTTSWNKIAVFSMGGLIARMAYSPDGRFLAAVGRIMRLWDMQTLQPLGQPVSGRDETLVDLTFSPDSRQLTFANVNGTIHLWTLDIQAWQTAACRVVNRNLTEAEWTLYFPGEVYRTTCLGE